MSSKMTRIRRRTGRRGRIRKRIRGSARRPRLSVFRSSRHLYVQLIDDDQGKTLFSISTLNLEGRRAANGGNVEAAKKVGKLVATRALEQGIDTVVFDRSGYLYHGRVRALAEAAREGGLRF